MTLLRPVLNMRQYSSLTGSSLCMWTVVDCTIVMRYVTVCHMYLQEELLLSSYYAVTMSNNTLERHNCSSFQTSFKSFAWYCLLFILPFEENFVWPFLVSPPFCFRSLKNRVMESNCVCMQQILKAKEGCLGCTPLTLLGFVLLTIKADLFLQE